MEEPFAKHFGGWSDVVSKDKFSQSLQNGFIQLAFLEDNFVGYVSFEPERDFSHSFTINAIHIKKSFQRKGYGLALLRFVIKKVTALHCSQLKLFVFKDNDAINFYKKIGFEEIETVYRTNTLIMLKKL